MFLIIFWGAKVIKKIHKQQFYGRKVRKIPKNNDVCIGS